MGPAQSTKKAHLLNVAAELRNAILDQLLQPRDEYDKTIHFSDGVLTHAPAILRVCTQLRNEAGPILFATRSATFRTFGELGMTLLSSPPTLKWWGTVQIEKSGRHETVRGEGRRWRLEPELALLVDVPNLRHVVLAGIELRTSSELRLSAIRPRGPPALPRFLRLRLAGVPLTGEMQIEEAKLLGKLEDVVKQVLDEVPESHPTLQCVEIVGLLKEDSPWGRRRDVVGRFRELWKWNALGAEWVHAERLFEPVEVGRSA